MAKSTVLTQNKNYITLKQRIKDKHAKKLVSLAREVNYVFNLVNDLSYQHIKRERKFLSAFDINEFTKGCTYKSLGESLGIFYVEVNEKDTTCQCSFCGATKRKRRCGGFKNKRMELHLRCNTSKRFEYSKQYSRAWEHASLKRNTIHLGKGGCQYFLNYTKL